MVTPELGTYGKTVQRKVSENPIEFLLLLTSVVFWFYVLQYGWLQRTTRQQYTAVVVAASVVIYVFNSLRTTIDDRNVLKLVAYLYCGVVIVVTSWYVYVNFRTLALIRTGYALEHEYVLAGLFVIAIIFLTYDKFGMAFVSVLVASLLYAHFGNLAPGVFRHGGFTIPALVNILVLEFRGMYGSIVRIIAADVALFLLYAGLLQAYGVFDLILRASAKLVYYIRSGVAQMAVVGSMIIGSINGSAAANSAMTGAFTIPLMKENDISSKSAAAIEATASSGGQIMPPIMGASAFIMASFLSTSYLNILIAGVVPALIFYGSVVIAVHFNVIRYLPDDPKIRQVDVDSEVDKGIFDIDMEKTRTDLMWDGLKFLIPFIVLLYLLGIAEYTIIRSALLTSLAMIATGVSFPVIHGIVTGRDDVARSVAEAIWTTADGFKIGATVLAPIVIIIVAVNAIVTVLQTTGMPSALSLMLIDLSGGMLLLAAIFGMIVCILLGLGMPTTAAYVLVAVLIAPTFISNFQIPAISVHFFVFYAAILSAVTPPIALAVVITAGIAGSNFWETCVEAVKISAPLFVLPIAFLYNPEIVSFEVTINTIISGTFIMIGAIAIAYGMNAVRISSNRVKAIAYRFSFVCIGVATMVLPATVVKTSLAILIGILLFIFHSDQMMALIKKNYVQRF